jgi:hypothetical protein
MSSAAAAADAPEEFAALADYTIDDFESAGAGTDGVLRTLVPAAGSCLLPPLARITLVGVKTKWRIHLLVSMASNAGTRPVTLKRCFVVHVAY